MLSLLSRRSLVTHASRFGLAALMPNELRDAPRLPDVVVVVMDDMRASDWIALPKTKALLANGTMFPNFIVSTPVCCPSRATMFTGQYPHNHRVMANTGNHGGWQAYRANGKAEESIHAAAQRRGYRTVISGKFLNGSPKQGGIGAGWSSFAITDERDYVDFALNVNGRKREYRGEGKYSTNVLANHAITAIAETRRDQPLLLFYTPKAPKGPATPDRDHAQDYADVPLSPSASFNEPDVSDKPGSMRTRNQLGPNAEATLTHMNRDRLRTLASVDDAMVKIVSAIQEHRDMANTYVFITSDHGYALGEHRLTGKGRPYDPMIRVPLLAFGPGFGGGDDDRLCGMVDLAPTIAAVTGASLAAPDGLSLIEQRRRDSVLIECWSGRESYTGLRLAHEVYVEYQGGDREYYDHATDPDELNNRLASWDESQPSVDPAYVAALASRLEAERTCSGEACWNPAAAEQGHSTKSRVNRHRR